MDEDRCGVLLKKRTGENYRRRCPETGIYIRKINGVLVVLACQRHQYQEYVDIAADAYIHVSRLPKRLKESARHMLDQRVMELNEQIAALQLLLDEAAENRQAIMRYLAEPLSAVREDEDKTTASLGK